VTLPVQYRFPLTSMKHSLPTLPPMASNSNAVLVVLLFWAYSAGEPRSAVACAHAKSVIGCAFHADFATTGAAVIAPDSRADHAFEGHKVPLSPLLPRVACLKASGDAPHSNGFLREAVGLALNGICELGIGFIGAQERDGATGLGVTRHADGACAAVRNIDAYARSPRNSDATPRTRLTNNQHGTAESHEC